MEPDETPTRNAAYLMVAKLVENLAHVTCKEPLCGSISGQLRSLLQCSNIASELLEQVVQLVTNDNLDLGCVLIEQAAIEKTQGQMGIFPEALRPKPGHLSYSQQRVYEEFGTAAQPTAPLACERSVSSVAEPLITTGDALDKYQTISENLENLLANDPKEAEIQLLVVLPDNVLSIMLSPGSNFYQLLCRNLH